ncbi:MAG: ATP-binding cassette domain-containing protein, partial [Acidimicrobiia bacterium]
PQTPYMFRGTVILNLELGLDSDESDHARQLAAELGVDQLLGKASDEVSVGEAQRICLARTLASKVPLVLLDEPLAPINAASRAEISGIIKARTKDRGLLWATHSLEAVRALADRLIVLDGGVVLQEGPVERVLADPASAQIAAIIGAA